MTNDSTYPKCGDCFFWRRMNAVQQGKPMGRCRVNPPHLTAVALPQPHPITGEINIAIQSVQSWPTLAVDEDGCQFFREAGKVLLTN